MTSVKRTRQPRWQRWLLYVAAAVLLFEEWLWRVTAQGLRAFARAAGVARIEDWLGRLPPWAALSIWGASLAILLPFKLAAVALLASGRFASGALVLLAAKFVGSAVLSWLYQCMSPALLQFPVVRRVRDALVRWICAARAWLHAQPAYRYVRWQLRKWHRHLPLRRAKHRGM